jgi:hypothetical protein
MATPADQRLLELLDKWLASLELHVKYSVLDPDSYSKIQPWPEHQRPSRWVIDLATQKAQSLKTQVEERIKMGDARFAESLELMAFLANLVGSQHIQRFIPLADPTTERVPTLEPPEGLAAPSPAARAGARAPGTATAEAAAAAAAAAASTATGTREMPKFVVPPHAALPAVTPEVARTERRATERRSPPELKAVVSTSPPKRGRNDPSEAAREQVIADAARLVQWGRKWYELAEIIAAMADRPHLTDVRRILKDNKSVIDQRAGRG